MSNSVNLLAQKFCKEYFCNADLSQKQFQDKVDESIKKISSIEGKLLFLNEVIKVSKSYFSEKLFNYGDKNMGKVNVAN